MSDLRPSSGGDILAGWQVVSGCFVLAIVGVVVAAFSIGAWLF